MSPIPISSPHLHTSAYSSPNSRNHPVPSVTKVTSRRLGPSHQGDSRAASLFTLPNEPEDARLTGGTRSLDRRLLALNLSGSLPKSKAAPERAAPPVRSAVA